MPKPAWMKHKVLNDIQELNGCRDGKVVVMTCGCFDVLHPGHIAYLRDAKARGDILVVSITKDEYVNKGPGRPVFAMRERMEQIAALESVDYIVSSIGPTAVEMILGVRPNIFVKGGDYDDSTFAKTEKEALDTVGANLVFTPYYSVPKSDLNGTFSAYSEDTQRWLEGFRQRHGADEILAAIDSMKPLNILVVGEVIEDKYVFVNTLTKSPREHHLSVKKLYSASYSGGSMAIRNHLLSFVNSVTLVRQQERIVKERFVEVHENRKLFSVQELPERLTLEQTGAEVLARAKDYDLVIAMDYGHGLFSDIRPRLEETAIFLAVNCQTNSANYGMNLATRWGRADYICMDRPEYNLAVANGWDIYSPKNVMVTNGSKGCDFGMNVPSLVTRLVDRVGAGDALFSITAPLVAKGIEPEIVAFVGSCAAAMQCETMGNEKSIDKAVLRKFIRRLV